MPQTLRHTFKLTRHRLTTAAVACAAAAAAAPAADAFVDYHYGAVGAYDNRYSNFYSLRASIGWSDGANHKVFVWARIQVPGGQPTQYAEAVGDWNYACHPYSGANTLQAVMHNPHSVGQNPMRGRAHVAPEGAC